MGLDLLITADTALAHLAGALGVRVWVVLQSVPDWRWLIDRADSPWYPTMRLFRQRTAGDWTEVFARVADELAAASAGSLRVSLCEKPRQEARLAGAQVDSSKRWARCLLKCAPICDSKASRF